MNIVKFYIVDKTIDEKKFHFFRTINVISGIVVPCSGNVFATRPQQTTRTVVDGTKSQLQFNNGFVWEGVALYKCELSHRSKRIAQFHLFSFV